MCNCGKKREIRVQLRTSQILDKVLPYTKDELRCGSKKRTKIYLRNQLITAIQEYKNKQRIAFEEFNLSIDIRKFL